MLIFLSSVLADAQQTTTQSHCQQLFDHINSAAPAGDQLVAAVEDSRRASRVRERWMDLLAKFGLKRAELTFRYRLGVKESFGSPLLKFDSIRYFQSYAQPLRVAATTSMNPAEQSALIKALKSVADDELRRTLPSIFAKANILRAEGTVKYSLFESECLPDLISDLIIESEQPETEPQSETQILNP